MYSQPLASQPAQTPTSQRNVLDGERRVVERGSCRLGCHVKHLQPQVSCFLHQPALVRAVISSRNNGPRQDETNKQRYLKKKWCCCYHHHHSFNSVFCLCHIFYNILFCHTTSLWWGQTLHLTIRATLALYFFFLQLSKIRAAALGLQIASAVNFYNRGFSCTKQPCVSFF